jgi:hypothetical protein
MAWYVTYVAVAKPETDLFETEETAKDAACILVAGGVSVVEFGSEAAGVRHPKLDAGGIEQMCRERRR